jgi:hypothetical protein
MCLMFDGSPWIRCLHCCQSNIITSTIVIEGFTDIYVSNMTDCQ